jgi:cytoskeletal protein CcmA (bactofilin family)
VRVFRRRRPGAEARASEPPAAAERERFTYLQHGTVVTGSLQASGRVRVHGTVRGDVVVDGLLEVAQDGVIDGSNVQATALVVLGRVRANVAVSGKVEVWKDGHLEGDVRAGALDIEEGATFVGRSDMPTRIAAAGDDQHQVEAPAAPPAPTGETPTATQPACPAAVPRADETQAEADDAAARSTAAPPRD